MRVKHRMVTWNLIELVLDFLQLLDGEDEFAVDAILQILGDFQLLRVVANHLRLKRAFSKARQRKANEKCRKKRKVVYG